MSLHRRSDIIISAGTRNERDIFANWLWALPVLLIVAALSLHQIDLYPPTSDEFYSMYNSGWLVNGPYSPVEVIRSLQTYSSNHTPGYFLLLSVWGSLTTTDVAIGRVLTIYCALLALSIGFRLARDFVAPAAGLFMIVVLASNAFFAFYIAHVRMYPLLMLSAGTALWLYLRLVHQMRDVRKTDYFALIAVVYLMLNVHGFSVTFLVMLGIYHLIVVPKSRRWWKVSAAIAAALILFSPYLPVLLTSGIELSTKHWGGDGTSGWPAIASWLTVLTNGRPLLLLSISLIGLTAGVLRKTISFKPYYLLVFAFVLGLGLTAERTNFVHLSGMRHQLPGWYRAGSFCGGGIECRVHLTQIVGLTAVTLGCQWRQTFKRQLIGATSLRVAQCSFTSIRPGN